jgi:transcriptional regulator with XRE-family HTH domain
MARSHQATSQAVSAAAGLLQLARLKAGLSQQQLADRAGVPATMVSAYERDKRQPTLPTLLRLLRAAGFDLRMHLDAYEQGNEAPVDRRQREAWRRAVPVT